MYCTLFNPASSAADSTVSEDAGIEHSCDFGIGCQLVIRSNLLARSHDRMHVI